MPATTSLNEVQQDWASPMYYSVTNDGYFPHGNAFVKQYGVPPSLVKISNANQLRKEFYPWLLANYPDHQILHYRAEVVKKQEEIDAYVFHIPSLAAYITLYPYRERKPLGESNLTCYIYYADRILIEPFLEGIKQFHHVIKPGRENNISLIIQKGSSIDVESFPVKIGNIDIGLNYGDEFVPIYNKIVKKLNTKNEKGLVLLHGIPGTGKTSLLKYLCKKVKKEILFVPPSMADSIANPSFVPFLMDHPNCVLIIEDAERVLIDRNGQGNTQGVSNVLNISDGILGDCLNVQIVATFNTNLSAIDGALLRKGRLIAEHHFKELNVDHSNRLLETLNKTHRTKVPMVLTDIYNIEEEEFRSQKERKAIGFGSR